MLAIDRVLSAAASAPADGGPAASAPPVPPVPPAPHPTPAQVVVALADALLACGPLPASTTRGRAEAAAVLERCGGSLEAVAGVDAAAVGRAAGLDAGGAARFEALMMEPQPRAPPPGRGD